MKTHKISKPLIIIILFFSLIFLPSTINQDPVTVEILDVRGVVKKLDKAFGIWVDVKPGLIYGEFFIRVGLGGKMLIEFPFGNQVIIKENSIVENKEDKKKEDEALAVSRG